jgi:hypothetical protein
MQDFFTIISNFGFPVAVASYLLFRFEKKLEILEQTNQELVKINNRFILEVKQLKRKIIEIENLVKQK